MSRIRVPRPLVVTTLYLLVSSGVSAQGELEYKMIRELPAEDTTTVAPEEIVKICTGILASRDKYGRKLVAEALLRRGAALSRLKRFDAALTDLDALLDLTPKDAKARASRASVLAN